MQVQTVTVPGEVEVFYRTAGLPANPTILLLHGFPTSSHQFRNLIPILAAEHHVVAPDLPGFGFTKPPADYTYSFENIAETISRFVRQLELTKYAIYMFDYGAPTGLRLALKDPEAVTAIISQNGNAYVEGLGNFWDSIRKLWQADTPGIRQQLAVALLSSDATKWQYEFGVTDGSRVKGIQPEGYWLDQALLDRPGSEKIQLDLFKDYASNVELYPKFQEYFREAQPPFLAVWGKNDAIFVPPGAEAFKKDLPDARIHFVDSGHFALESHLLEISTLILEFLRSI